MIIATILLLVIIISGVWLKRRGTPYSRLVITAHKLISLAFIAMGVIAVKKAIEFYGVSITDIVLLAFLALAIIISLVSGGIMSHHNSATRWLVILHTVSSFLIVIFSALATINFVI